MIGTIRRHPWVLVTGATSTTSGDPKKNGAVKIDSAGLVDPTTVESVTPVLEMVQPQQQQQPQNPLEEETTTTASTRNKKDRLMMVLRWFPKTVWTVLLSVPRFAVEQIRNRTQPKSQRTTTRTTTATTVIEEETPVWQTIPTSTAAETTTPIPSTTTTTPTITTVANISSSTSTHEKKAEADATTTTTSETRMSLLPKSPTTTTTATTNTTVVDHNHYTTQVVANFSGVWELVVTPQFQTDYDLYLQRLGQPKWIRSIAVNIVAQTTETIVFQKINNNDNENDKLTICTENIRGRWERTFVTTTKEKEQQQQDSPTTFKTNNSNHNNDNRQKNEIQTVDGERVPYRAWWEQDGQVHVSWLFGVQKNVAAGGGNFESKRYLEIDPQQQHPWLVCESTFHPNDSTKPKAQIVWKFRPQQQRHTHTQKDDEIIYNHNE